ncbi:MAG TPA: type IV pili methyl-accepting chemotaxis transducer N-terminal domain-containing protein, partial [Anseongella sp.]|nr:type IV pili methyl-accepting chemotaxis transducer N-terminal domain-containing protein [Anseongella sp.]
MKKDRHRFTRLGTWYILALGAVALIMISGQVLVQQFLNDQSDDSRVVNVAGRQRMLSQKIAKIALSLKSGQDSAERSIIRKELSAARAEWQLSQEGLLEGSDSLRLPLRNSPRVLQLFAGNRQFYQSMLEGSRGLLGRLENDPLAPYAAMEGDIQLILKNEPAFLATMDSIVFQYDREARQKVEKLKRTEYILLGISLFIILLEILFIFLPTTRQINNTLRKLIESEKSAQKMAKEIGALYTSLENSYEKISHINLPVENPRLYARADKGGNVKYVSELFARL